jgi:hypothetical protein
MGDSFFYVRNKINTVKSYKEIRRDAMDLTYFPLSLKCESHPFP